MLARIKAERDVDYVIVYNLSRLNRNRVDDAQGADVDGLSQGHPDLPRRAPTKRPRDN